MVERYSFYFRIPNREKPVIYSFHTNVTIRFFIDFITEEMMYFSPNSTIQIFEVVEGNSKNKLNYLETSTLKEIYEDKLDKISFDIQFIS